MKRFLDALRHSSSLIIFNIFYKDLIKLIRFNINFYSFITYRVKYTFFYQNRNVLKLRFLKFIFSIFEVNINNIKNYLFIYHTNLSIILTSNSTLQTLCYLYIYNSIVKTSSLQNINICIAVTFLNTKIMKF